jgi:hypothetical protein
MKSNRGAFIYILAVTSAIPLLSSSLGRAESLDECMTQAESYGNANGPSSIDSLCAERARDHSNGLRLVVLSPGRSYAYGYGNFLAFHEYGVATPGSKVPVIPKADFIAGSATLLKSVAALASNRDGSVVAVLDRQSKEVLFFNAKLPGNVAPIKVLQAPELANAVALAWWPEAGELILSTGRSGRIVIVPDQEAARALSNEHKVRSFRSIEGSATGLIAPLGLALDVSNGELWVADPASNRVSAFSVRGRGDIAPLRVISGLESGLNRPTALRYDGAHGEIIVTNSDGSRLRFTRLGVRQ